MSARKMSSDHEKAEFLLANARRYTTEQVRSSWFHAVDSINSDHDRGRVLIGMLEADGRSPRDRRPRRKVREADDSDHEKAQVLLAIPSGSEDAQCAALGGSANHRFRPWQSARPARLGLSRIRGMPRSVLRRGEPDSIRQRAVGSPPVRCWTARIWMPWPTRKSQRCPRSRYLPTTKKQTCWSA